MTCEFEKEVVVKLEVLLTATENNLSIAQAALEAMRALQQEIAQIDDRVFAIESQLAQQERDAR